MIRAGLQKIKYEPDLGKKNVVIFILVRATNPSNRHTIYFSVNHWKCKSNTNNIYRYDNIVDERYVFNFEILVHSSVQKRIILLQTHYNVH